MTSMSPMASMSPEERMQYNTDPPGAGWLFFAGTMLGLAGLMRVVDSIWAFRYNGALPSGLKDGVLGDNLTTYGWVWLVVGIVLIISSFMLLSGSEFARWIGIFAAAIMAISAVTWMPYYPVWSLTYVLLAGLTLYGLAAHGGRVTRSRTTAPSPII